MTYGERIREQMLRYIKTYIEQHGHPPTFDEIGQRLSMSKSGVHHHIEVLESSRKIRYSYSPMGNRLPRTLRVKG